MCICSRRVSPAEALTERCHKGRIHLPHEQVQAGVSIRNHPIVLYRQLPRRPAHRTRQDVCRWRRDAKLWVAPGSIVYLADGSLRRTVYRWFPTGKIVFLAPTKPLVNQQIEACQLTCGIPSADAAVMTGQSVSAKERAKLWAERRVFYCTPQTLDNDLKNGSVDPLDIVLAVFGE